MKINCRPQSGTPETPFSMSLTQWFLTFLSSSTPKLRNIKLAYLLMSCDKTFLHFVNLELTRIWLTPRDFSRTPVGTRTRFGSAALAYPFWKRMRLKKLSNSAWRAHLFVFLQVSREGVFGPFLQRAKQQFHFDQNLKCDFKAFKIFNCWESVSWW